MSITEYTNSLNGTLFSNKLTSPKSVCSCKVLSNLLSNYIKTKMMNLERLKKKYFLNRYRFVYTNDNIFSL